jgi:hypothetical protein
MVEPRKVDLVQAPISVRPDDDQAGVSKYAKVLARGGLPEPNELRELGDSPLGLGAQPHKLAPRRMGERRERTVDRLRHHACKSILPVLNMQGIACRMLSPFVLAPQLAPRRIPTGRLGTVSASLLCRRQG